MTDYFGAFVNNFFSRYLTSNHVCVYLKYCENKTENMDFESWKSEVLADKPTVVAPQEKSNKTFHVLHITDLHTDLEYTVGSLADCDQPFCCRPESGETPTNST